LYVTHDDLGRTPFVCIRRSGVRCVGERRRRGRDASNLTVLILRESPSRPAFLFVPPNRREGPTGVHEIKHDCYQLQLMEKRHSAAPKSGPSTDVVTMAPAPL